MRIVIEGCDGTGKTTLCELLSTATGWPVVTQSPRPPRSEEEYRDTCDRAIWSARGEHLISDRWPTISNRCYSAIGRGATVEDVAISLRAAMVDRILHCDVEDPSHLRIVARPGDPLDAVQTEAIRDQAPALLGRYRELMGALRAKGFDVRRYVMMRGSNNG